MTSKFGAAMRRAAAATRSFNVLGATRLIQRTLARRVVSHLFSRPSEAASPLPKVPASKNKARTADKSVGKIVGRKAPPKDTGTVKPRAKTPARFRRPLGEVIETLRVAPALTGRTGLLSFGSTGKAPDLVVPDGAEFVSRSFTSNAGSREFKLYIPASAQDRPKGLIIMLHGCTQGPDDFAAGTNMNAVAETHGLLIAYPAQTRTNNASSCWNWFETGHQRRGEGEPAILAGLTRKLAKEFGIDKDQVYAAGLSAGAAMAVILGKTYPDLFSAVGVHSGLAYQSAGNVMSALAVMRGNAGSSMFGKASSPETDSRPARTIIFHGSADRTVHPSNARRILDSASGAAKQGKHTTASGAANGRRFTQTTIAHQNGYPLVESWLIDGAGHAWSGGKSSGSYTDAQGPDASSEMVRFFLNAK
jgi:poly(hydroxyalkanoate) depolymerase family esterase